MKLALPNGWHKVRAGAYMKRRFMVLKYNAWGCPWHVLKDGVEVGAGYHTAREALDAAERWHSKD